MDDGTASYTKMVTSWYEMVSYLLKKVHFSSYNPLNIGLHWVMVYDPTSSYKLDMVWYDTIWWSKIVQVNINHDPDCSAFVIDSGILL